MKNAIFKKIILGIGLILITGIILYAMLFLIMIVI